ncbi:WXG100 family type VII secretion target [Lacrimispora sp. BS-2]|uniref:ESAT-6-like protein n=1 Tax=Lacrimispora sp. BS-2 TaxID=3151850 RepID=A0AAU7PJC3_9FIRM
MGLITVSSAQLKSTATELRSLNNNFKSQVGNLESSEGTLASMWEGQAKTAFHNAFTKDKGQMNVFYQEIEKYCTVLETIAAKYDRTEDTNAETATTRNY